MSRQTVLSRRGDQIIGPPFPGGLPPTGTFLGVDSVFERRMGLDHDLRNGTLALGGSLEQA